MMTGPNCMNSCLDRYRRTANPWQDAITACTVSSFMGPEDSDAMFPGDFARCYDLKREPKVSFSLKSREPQTVNACCTCGVSSCVRTENAGRLSRKGLAPIATCSIGDSSLPLRDTLAESKQAGEPGYKGSHLLRKHSDDCFIEFSRNATLSMTEWSKTIDRSACAHSAFLNISEAPSSVPRNILSCGFQRNRIGLVSIVLLKLILNCWTLFSGQSNFVSVPQDPGSGMDGKMRRGKTIHSSFNCLSQLAMLLSSLTAIAISAAQAMDLRENINRGMEPCFHYTPEEKVIEMNCSILHWQDHGYTSDTFISLGATEVFDGSPTNDGNTSLNIIDLGATTGFNGIFKIHDDEISTLADTPLIKNVHIRNGTTAEEAGFIVQQEQRYFNIVSCSSTGDITNDRAGGICGYKCGHFKGEINISNSFSRGRILGSECGGIAGDEVGHNGGVVRIAYCYSSGNIEGESCGGICGGDPGHSKGHVHIKQCYSTGDIVAPSAHDSGSIVGDQPAYNKGYVLIQECFSTGNLSAKWSGGISGSFAADREGQMHILNCYTQGHINGEYTGGITGRRTGSKGSNGFDFGDVYINNTYSSGVVTHKNAGGIIGSLYHGFKDHNIHVQYSVYNSEASRIVGFDPGDHVLNNVTTTFLGNSQDIKDIRGQLYHYQGVQRWDDDIWDACEPNELPVLGFQRGCRNTTGGTSSSITRDNPIDLRERIRRRMEPCFHYIAEKNLIRLNCTVLHWQAQGYTNKTYISLGNDDMFDGGGITNSSGKDKVSKDTMRIIDLSGIIGFRGLIKIREDVTEFENAPVIRNVHVRNGKLAKRGGFIVRKHQGNFLIDSCSSTGEITNWAGGIAGLRVGVRSKMQISNSFSSGKIIGNQAGGIVGEQVGRRSGYANITRCYSTGKIEGGNAGGICGWGAGLRSGVVHITQCYSTGDIMPGAAHSGGIAGKYAARKRGYVGIRECFSTGKISGPGSGGIVGAEAANTGGEVGIIDCFTSGDVGGHLAGGITGVRTGGSFSIFGDVYITNTYASGMLLNGEVGAFIGSIHSEFRGHTIHAQYSVYNNNTGEAINIVGNGDPGSHLETQGISGNLGDIRGQLYHYAGEQKWDRETWVVKGIDSLLPGLAFHFETKALPQSGPGKSQKRFKTRRELQVQLPNRTVRQLKVKHQKKR